MQKVVLTVTDNKCQLTRIICEELVQDQKIQQGGGGGGVHWPSG